MGKGKHAKQMAPAGIAGGPSSCMVPVTVLLLIVGIIARVCCMDIVSGDMKTFLVKWYMRAEEAGGLSSLSKSIGNYNIFYQTLVALLTYLPFQPIHAYKLLSIVFDATLAGVSVYLYRTLSDTVDFERSMLVFGVVWALPTTFLNSAAWGQCDSIYATFVLVAIALLMRKKPYWSAFTLGLAFACKLQTVLVLPFFLIWFVCADNRPNFLKLVALMVLGFYLPCLPGIFAGRGLLDPVLIYTDQADLYKRLTLGYPNIWGIVGSGLFWLRQPAMVLAGVGVLAALIYAKVRRIDVSNKRSAVLVLIWTTWYVLMTLPSMHDRYGYVLTLVVVLFATCDRRFLPFAIGLELLDLDMYVVYLFTKRYLVSFRWASAAYVLVFVCFTFFLIREARSRRTDSCVDC